MTDRSARFQHWFQLITNVAILFGLGLVVYELNQSKQLATAQFVIDNMARETSIQLARMGEDPEKSVVNPWGRSHDVKNLFIVDGSIFVTGGGLNPTSTIQALALYIADSMKKNLANLFD